MPRPCKKRCVSALPLTKQFGPLDITASDSITMSVEEYEVIKLIDLENLTQAETAQQLDVSRTTVQTIYQSARQKIAQALVEVKTININGGNYRLRKMNNCPKHIQKGIRCHNENCSSK